MLNLTNFPKPTWTATAFAAACLLSLVPVTVGRAIAQAAPLSTAVQLSSVPDNPQSNTTAGAPPAITFADALQRARTNNPQMQAAFTALGLSHEDLVQSRAALLPNVNYNMQAIYTQPTSRGSKDQIFIANNGVHEYIAQENIHQNLSLQTLP